jgi:hypothetical protein
MTLSRAVFWAERLRCCGHRTGFRLARKDRPGGVPDLGLVRPITWHVTGVHNHVAGFIANCHETRRRPRAMARAR